MGSMFSQAPLALGSDTSLLRIPAPHADTLVILQLIVLPTPLTFLPCLYFLAQLTRLANNFIGHNFAI